jgi:hypothetical protein
LCVVALVAEVEHMKTTVYGGAASDERVVSEIIEAVNQDDTLPRHPFTGDVLPRKDFTGCDTFTVRVLDV